MSLQNHTVVSEFMLSGFMNLPTLQVPLFIAFSVIYVIRVVGNLGMVVLIKIDPQLHTPMYFFLSNLSFTDFCYSSLVTPKALENFLSARKAISFTGCFIAMATTECILFALMAYDHYVTISNPLLCMAIMTQKLCLKMATGAYTEGFCSNFFYKSLPLLSCSNTHINENVIFIINDIGLRRRIYVMLDK